VSDLWSGQDSWVVTADISHTVNLDGITVESPARRNGLQGGVWDAGQMDFDDAHLRRNELFSPPTGEPIIEILFDLEMKDGAVRSGDWGLDVYAGPLFRLTRWGVLPTGEVRVLDAAISNCANTGFFLDRDTWYRTRTAIDTETITVDLFIDGTWVYTAEVIDKIEAFAFAALFLADPGDDMLAFDNFVVGTAPRQTLMTDRHVLVSDGAPVDFSLAPALSTRAATIFSSAG